MKTKRRTAIVAASTLILAIGASSSLAVEVFTFGSDNDGLAGFTQSSTPQHDSDGDMIPDLDVEFWTTQAGSVQYRNQNNGTRNSSFLRAFPLDRSVGKSYRMEGVVTLTDGYVDDNNRVGFYLFGDSPEVPNEDEVGAIGFMFNTDDGVADAVPDTNADDRIYLAVGIDSGILGEAVDRNPANTSFAQDLFGTTIKFTADIEFINDGTDDLIQVDGTLTDADGAETKVSTQVLAADYTGDYFGFVTRARARNYVEGGENTAAGQSLPWVMDYRSFSVSGLSLDFTPNEGTPGSYDFSWVSKSGRLYDLVSDTVLSNPTTSWPVWEGNSDIMPSGTGINTLTAVPGGGDGRRFFSVIERKPPPLLDESFDAEGPALPDGWVAVNATTVWDVGDPSGLPGLLDGDGTNCVGTNVVASDYADEVATITLSSPAVPIPAGGATLAFRQYIDSDLGNGDFGTIRLLDATDTEIVEGDFPVSVDGITNGWTEQSLTLPPSAADQSVKVVFEFTTAMDGTVYKGFYIDDVMISAN